MVENYNYKLANKSYYRISYYENRDDSDVLVHIDLPISYIMIRLLPKVNAGFLIISVTNSEYDKLETIKKINQYGRRIYNPFQSVRLSFTEAPNNLEIIAEDELATSPKETDYLNRYHLMDAPRQLLQGFFGLKDTEIFPEKVSEEAKILPIIDDRMFVTSYLTAPSLKDIVSKSKHYVDLSFDGLKELYALAYIDKEGSSCLSFDMLTDLVDAASYRRWVEYGTLYLMTQHSFLFISTSSAPDFLYHTFQSLYLDMVLLVLAQRVGILSYSSRAGESVKKSSSELLALQESYVTFKNQYMLPEISAQEQAVELYDKLQRALYIEKYFAILDQQITSLHEIAQTKEAVRQRKDDEELNQKVYLLTLITVLPVMSEFFDHLYSVISCMGKIPMGSKGVVRLFGYLIGIIGIIGAILCKLRMSKNKKGE